MTEQDHPRVRASDAEREQVAAALRYAMEEGRLNLAEGEERLAQVYATTYRDELPGLTADLPPRPEAGPGRAGPYRGGSGPGGSGRPRGDGPPWGGGPPWGSGRPGGSGRPRGSGPPRPVAGLAAVLAVVATVWALAAGGPVWPAIVLGVIALMALKHSGGGCAAGRAVHRQPAGDRFE